MHLRPFYLFFLISAVLAFSTAIQASDASDVQVRKRVEAYLLLQDPRSAYDEVMAGLTETPQSLVLQESLIRVLAKIGDEKAMLAAWKRYASLNPQALQNRDLLEDMAWGIIEKGNLSQSTISRVMALLAGFFSNSSRGVDLLHNNIDNSNSLIRGISVQLAGHMRDSKLRQDVLRVFRKEKVWNVRLEAIQALGKMQIHEAKEDLEAIIAQERTPAEEKAVALEALVGLLDTAKREEIQHFATSSRSGLRLLACEAVALFDLWDDLDLILPLTHDHSPEVRAEALQTIGVMRVEHIKDSEIADLAREKLKDTDRRVAITAAWLLTLHSPLEGQQALTKWLNHPTQDVRLFAAAALSATGKYGMPLIRQVFFQTRDPYVKLNLAFGLISQREESDMACQALYDGLTGEKGRWMWEERGLFRMLAPSTVKHKEDIPQYPEVVNQLVRLEVIQILAFMHHPQAQTAMKSFLKERLFGVTGIAMALMLTEGDEEALDLVRALLDDSEPQVRVQAALILAMWGRDEVAVEQLQKSYQGADREFQEKILEGIGHIGSEISLPFLIERLQEPFQNLRIIAACALLECLNH